MMVNVYDNYVMFIVVIFVARARQIIVAVGGAVVAFLLRYHHFRFRLRLDADCYSHRHRKSLSDYWHGRHTRLDYADGDENADDNTTTITMTMLIITMMATVTMVMIRR